MGADPPDLRTALAAALDPTGWCELLESVAPEVGATAAMFAAVHKPSAAVIRADVIGFDRDLETFWREYDAGMHLYDRQLHAIASDTGPRVFTDIDHDRPDDLEGLEFLRWQEARLGVRHHVSFFTDVDDISIGLSFHRTSSAGPASEKERVRLREIGRELTPALHLAYRHAELLTDTFWAGVSARDRRCACLLDRFGRVIRTSPRFEHVLRAGELLRLEGKRLVALDEQAGSALSAALASLATGRERRAAAIPLSRGGESPSIFSLYPLDETATAKLPGAAATLGVLTNPAQRQGRIDRRLQRAFGLTLRETKVAALLADGRDLEQIAADLSISRETVRVHLRNIFAKTDTRRQTEFIRLITLLQNER